MHVGMTTFFQNLGQPISDCAVYRHEISMADLAEPLGFDSIWGAEHHFDDYTMCPNVAQFLTYMAGRMRPGHSRNRPRARSHRVPRVSRCDGRIAHTFC